jgi:Hemerythrin HHE cation binding domain
LRTNSRRPDVIFAGERVRMEATEIISAVMAQHKVIVSQIDTTGDAVGDLAAVLRLERARGDLTSSFRQTLDQKLSRLQQVIAPLDRGLRNHYRFEEDVLPPLLGRVLTLALFSEHKQLLRLMDQATSLIATVKGADLTRDEQMSKESAIYSCLDELRGAKLDHLTREEAILVTLHEVVRSQTSAT